MVEPITDQQLLENIKQGSEDSFSVLFKRYFPLLLHYGEKFTHDSNLSKECIQELFIYLYEHPHLLANIKSPKTYFYTAFRRQLITAVRKQQKLEQQKDILPDPLNIQFSKEDILIEQEEQQQQRTFISQLLNQLPARQREAVYLKYYGELSTKEIANIMGISPQGVLNMLYKAIKKLRKHAIFKCLAVFLFSVIVILVC